MRHYFSSSRNGTPTALSPVSPDDLRSTQYGTAATATQANAANQYTRSTRSTPSYFDIRGTRFGSTSAITVNGAAIPDPGTSSGGHQENNTGNCFRSRTSNTTRSNTTPSPAASGRKSANSPTISPAHPLLSNGRPASMMAGADGCGAAGDRRSAAEPAGEKPREAEILSMFMVATYQRRISDTYAGKAEKRLSSKVWGPDIGSRLEARRDWQPKQAGPAEIDHRHGGPQVAFPVGRRKHQPAGGVGGLLLTLYPTPATTPPSYEGWLSVQGVDPHPSYGVGYWEWN